VVDLGGWTTGLLTTSETLRHLILPAITLSLFQLALIMRLVRAEMLEVLRTDYIKFARARGLSDRVVHFGHALRNTLVPVITITGLQTRLVDRLRHHHRDGVPVAGHGPALHPGGAVRRHPGDGGLPVLISLIFVVINLVVDLLYFAVDPRLRVDDRQGAGHETPHPPRLPPSALAAGSPATSLRFAARRWPCWRPPLLVACIVCALFAPLIAPHNPFDLASAEPDGRAAAAGLGGGRQPHIPARHRRPGPRHPLGAVLRRAHLAARRFAAVLLSVAVGVRWA
jgi:hypothetical protein